MKTESSSSDESKLPRGSTGRRLFIASLSLALIVTTAGCVGTGALNQPVRVEDEGSSEPCNVDVADDTVTIDCLALSFEMPRFFQQVEESDLLFLAMGGSTPAVLSIDRDSPDVVEHRAEDGESLTQLTIDGVEAVVVTDAVIEGLEPGKAARELLVANGDRSFSLIMSAPEQDLPSIWDPLMSSLEINTET